MDSLSEMVSTGSIVAAGASLFLLMLIPVIIMGVVKGRLEGKFRMAALGFLLYFIPVAFLNFIVKNLFFPNGDVKGSYFVYYIMATFPFVLFEILTKCIAFKKSFKLEGKKGNAYMFGLGFSYAYMFSQYAISLFVSLITLLAVKRGTAQELLDIAKENDLGQTETAIEAVVETSAGQYLEIFISCGLLMALSIAITLVIYYAFSLKKKGYIAIAGLAYAASWCIGCLLTWADKFILGQLVELLAIIALVFLLLAMKKMQANKESEI